MMPNTTKKMRFMFHLRFTEGDRVTNSDLTTRALAASRFLELHQSHVDVLPSRRLLAMHRDAVAPRTERRAGFRGNGHLLVIRRERFHLRGQDPVEVNLGVLVVMEAQVDLAERRVGQQELLAEPDV